MYILRSFQFTLADQQSQRILYHPDIVIDVGEEQVIVVLQIRAATMMTAQ